VSTLTPAQAAPLVDKLRDNIRSVFIGHGDAVNQLITCLLARGHVLIEDVPGVGKTVLATALARSLDCTFSRIQLTPDMLPADVLGVTVFNRPQQLLTGNGDADAAADTGQHADFRFKPGPIFANIVLADEINRTTPRTQSALLEVMNEGTVSVEGRTMTLDPPFMVVATQNPFEFEGTYLLPENQLDRFLMRLTIGYPSPEDEARVLELRPSDAALHELEPVMHAADVVALQRATDTVRMDRSLIEYIVALGNATRSHAELQVGLSPRGTLALAQAARASAVLHGRDYAIPEDIVDHAAPVIAHRLVTSAFMRTGDAAAAEDITRAVLQDVPSPA
jgi:MoxR-like ATPase